MDVKWIIGVALLIVAALAGAVVGAVHLLRYARQRKRRRQFQGVYPQLRARALGSPASKLGIYLERGDLLPWGAILEIGYPQATATLVALRNGDATLYFSNSGALTGAGGRHSAVRDAARQFVTLANDHLPAMSKAKGLPSPEVGRVRFYIRTAAGIFSTEQEERELADGSHRLSGLYFAAQNVIKHLRAASGGEKKR